MCLRLRGENPFLAVGFRRILKKLDSKAAAAESAEGVTFSPARPELLAQF